MWLSNYDSRVVIRIGTGGTSLSVTRADGKSYLFTLLGGSSITDSDVTDRLAALIDGSGNFAGWQYWVGDTDDVWSYDVNGRPTSITTRSGYVQSMAYGANNLLASVTDSFGRALVFTYDANNRVQTVTDPAGLISRYGYDANNNLTTITFPDKKIRQYVYDAPTLANALTGIIDENGVRFATWTYNSSGRAIASQYAGGANLTSVTSYGGSATTVRDAAGTSTDYGFSTYSGVYKNTSLSTPCAGCGLAALSTYDTNGNALSRKDFIAPTAKMTCYAYDMNRNLETARAEGISASESCSAVLATLPSRPNVRKVSTQWHAIWRLPIKTAEPYLVTTNAYNGDSGVFCAPTGAQAGGNPIGVLCKRTVQETTDATGQQGLGAPLTGTPRVWRYTYDQFGQVLTATDPNGKVTTTVYYATTDPDLGKRGNVNTISNAVGHITTFTGYDGNGRPLSITDPNGVVTTLTYWPRGWLHTRTVAGETMTHEYDGVGQLTKVTQPDGSYVQYIYDNAHRLTDIIDTLGNRIHYTLDAMGNRITEAAFEPGGYPNTPVRLKRQVYDSLNRLHQAVGAQ